MSLIKKRCIFIDKGIWIYVNKRFDFCTSWGIFRALCDFFISAFILFFIREFNLIIISSSDLSLLLLWSSSSSKLSMYSKNSERYSKFLLILVGGMSCFAAPWSLLGTSDLIRVFFDLIIRLNPSEFIRFNPSFHFQVLKNVRPKPSRLRSHLTYWLRRAFLRLPKNLLW